MTLPPTSRCFASTLADEPTGALDRGNTELVIGLLRATAEDGACVIIATHNDWVRGQRDESVPIDAYADRKQS